MNARIVTEPFRQQSLPHEPGGFRNRMLYPPDTPVSLLDRVKHGDMFAWAEFSERCLSVLRVWSLRWGLQPADADDLIQNTLIIVLTRIRTFRHRGTGSFRSWIRMIAWHCFCDALALSKKTPPSETMDRIRDTPEARQTLEEEFDRIFELQLLEDAMRRVQGRVQQSTWEAFQLTAIQGLAARDASEQTGLTPDAVYAARARVQRLIAIELKLLSEE
jgi:RNA polymerase sigma-70 factor (ECF subfamily)